MNDLQSLAWLQWQIAANMISIMDRTVDPCEDFYKFACGHYDDRVTIDKSFGQMNPLAQATFNLQAQIEGTYYNRICNKAHRRSK